MPHDPILHLLGLARKAGKLELGEEPVGALCRARHARLVLLADNAAPTTIQGGMGEWGHRDIRQLDFEDIFYKSLYKRRNVLKYSIFYFSCQQSTLIFFFFSKYYTST